MIWLAALTLHQAPSVDQLNALLKAGDVANLTQLLDPLPKSTRNPFKVVTSGGSYDVGRFGWQAIDMPSLDGGPAYVVVSTKLTSEDLGEMLFRRDGDKLKFVPEQDTMGVHIDRHNFVVHFFPNEKRVDIVDQVQFTERPGVDRFVTRMSPQYRIKEIQDENGMAVAFSQAGGSALVRGGRKPNFSYRFTYSAIVDLPGYAGSISSGEATLTNDYWYPMIGRNPAPYQAEIHAPPTWTAVAQGELLSTKRNSAESVTKYKMDLPVTYYSLSAAPYKTFSQVIGGRRFTIWSLRMSQESMREQTEFYAPILKFYERFSPYPFSGYGAVDSAVYGGGALEAYSFATYGGGLPAEDAHEPSHTWWGGIIDNTYLDSFWNESFAVFCEGLYSRNCPIGLLAERRLAFISDGRGESSYEATPILGSGADAGPSAGALGYGKGSRVLQMLEQFVGTKKMVQIMHDWIQVHQKGTAGDWPEFVSVAEHDAPGLNLRSFFDDWLGYPGYARLSADISYRSGKTKIKLSWKGKRYRMPLLVLLRSAKGKDEFRLFDTGLGDEMVIRGPKPSIVSVDPYRQALRDVDSSETPVQLSSVSFTHKLVEAAHKDWIPFFGGSGSPLTRGSDLDSALVVGSPETDPLMKSLCAKVGFSVKGATLTYKGTRLDLNHGVAMAIVDLGHGKYCQIGLGKSRIPPRYGRARLALTDDLGRFLRGETEPKTKGKLTAKLG